MATIPPPILTPNIETEPITVPELEDTFDRVVGQFKKGHKTTEFWTTLVAIGGIIGAKASGVELDVEGMVGITGILASYVFGRSWLKGKRTETLPVPE